MIFQSFSAFFRLFRGKKMENWKKKWGDFAFWGFFFFCFLEIFEKNGNLATIEKKKKDSFGGLGIFLKMRAIFIFWYV
jgi:hypothetical protein